MPSFSPAPALTGADSRLAANSAIGAGTLSLRVLPPGGIYVGYIAIDPFTIDCEIRRISSISASAQTVNLDVPLSYAHSAADKVLFFQGDEVPAGWFGAVADGSTGGGGTDSEPMLQRAVDECSRYGITVDGAVGTYALNLNLILPPGATLLRRCTLVPGSSYPLTGADKKDTPFLTNRQGAKAAFTADAATDVFTSTAHGLPQDGVGVVFKNLTGVAGITAGRVYYARDITTNTFKVSATRSTAFVPGSAVNVTSNGSGEVHLEVLSLQRVNVKDVYIYGRGLDIVGAAFNAQQPSYFDNFRIDFCGREALILSGQEADFDGTIIVGNGAGSKGLVIEGASIMRFKGFNTEYCENGIYVRPTSEATMFGIGGGGGTIFFKGVHFENQSAGASVVDINIAGDFGPVSFENVTTSLNLSTQKFLWAHNGTGEVAASDYSLFNVWFVGASSGGADVMAIQDDDRAGVPDRRAFTDFEREIVELHHGQSGVSKSGHYFTNALLPADALISAGEVFWSFDPTPGSTKVQLKAKDSDGIVGTVVLPLGLTSELVPVSTVGPDGA